MCTYSISCCSIFSGEKNYTVCFVFFCLFMICALIAATRFTFVYEGVKENIQLGELKNQIWKKAKKAGQIVTRPASFGRQRLEEEEPDGYPSTGYDTNTTKNEEYSGYGPSPYSTTMDEKRDPEKRVQITLQGENGAVGTHPGGAVQDVSDLKTTIISTHVPRGEPGRSGTLPEMMTVLKMFGTIHYGAMLYLTWFMGFGVGLMFTFLFWHLQVCKRTSHNQYKALLFLK